MSLVPAATITLGNLRYTTQAAAIGVSLNTLPGAGSASIRLPADVRLEAAPDDDAILELDGGEGGETILTGKVRGLCRGLLTTEVDLGDGGAQLARLRPSATHEGQSAKDVIRALADEAGVEVDTIDIDLPLAAYVAHQGRTAAEHVAGLASLAGGIATITADGALRVGTWPDGQPDLALKYGRELVTYEVREHPAPAARRVITGSGPAGEPSAPDALRPSLESLPAGSPAPGAAARWTPALVLRTPGGATTAGAGAAAALAAGGKRLQARAFLLPAVRPGMVIEIQDLPSELAPGPWIVTRVTHRLRPGAGGITIIEGVSGEGGGLGSLLGSALAAVGGLL